MSIVTDWLLGFRRASLRRICELLRQERAPAEIVAEYRAGPDRA